MKRLASMALGGALVFAFPLLAAAQSLSTQLDPVQFVITPEVPMPGETVLIEAKGVGSFLGDSTISWQLDGKTMKSGVGERTFSFIAGSLGTQNRVRVTITSNIQGTITRSFVFLPSLVNLVWEADTTVPPWYGSKAMYSAGSRFTVAAFPQIVVRGAGVPYNNLSFKWNRNGKVVPEASGTGRNVFVAQGNQLLGNETIGVDIVLGDTIVARSTITIPARAPQILFYERDPLRGTLFDTALRSPFTLSTKEITFQAIPYFFAKESVVRNSIPFTWQLNGKNTTGPESAVGALTLRQASSGAGRAQLSVAIQNSEADKFVQTAKTTLQLVFGGTQNSLSTFFGL